jgi:hypothetical protein
MLQKKVIMRIPSVYTANAFRVGEQHFVGAGSETEKVVHLYDLGAATANQVSGCPGGMMSFIPVPGEPDLFITIQGLFPPFIGADAGLYSHRRTGEGWETRKVLDMPFSHRCEILTRSGKNHLFLATVSKHKDNPADWSRPGEMHLVRLDEVSQGNWETEIIDNSITRNHGMSRAIIGGQETILVSGAEGIFYLEQSEDAWKVRPFFEKEVSEMSFIDLDGDGKDEMVTIEPFHGDRLNIYKKTGDGWERRYSDSLSFGHGLSSGIFNGRPLIIAGNRSDSLALVSYEVEDLSAMKVNSRVIEEGTGPTQTQVFSQGTKDYILSANQKKNEVALYC